MKIIKRALENSDEFEDFIKIESDSDNKLIIDVNQENTKRFTITVDDKWYDRHGNSIFKIEPKYGPADEVYFTVTDTPILFRVMEVHHGKREYKITSIDQIKPITLIVKWSELEKND